MVEWNAFKDNCGIKSSATRNKLCFHSIPHLYNNVFLSVMRKLLQVTVNAMNRYKTKGFLLVSVTLNRNAIYK